MPVPGIWVWGVRTASEGAVSKTESKKKNPKNQKQDPRLAEQQLANPTLGTP